jgi:hypothetical protein
MSGKDGRERVREMRRRLACDGPPWTPDHAGDFETVSVPERDCDALRDLLIAEGVETVVEVGLAYGRSALAIGEALVAVAARRPRHVIIDPLQATEWSNVGWQLLRRAGLDTIARLVLQPSSLALPQLVAEGFTGAFAAGTIDQETPPGAAPPRPALRALPAVLIRPPGQAVLTQTDTCVVLSLVKGARVQSLQRSRKVMAAKRAMRSSSEGQT